MGGCAGGLMSLGHKSSTNHNGRGARWWGQEGSGRVEGESRAGMWSRYSVCMYMCMSKN